MDDKITIMARHFEIVGYIQDRNRSAPAPTRLTVDLTHEFDSNVKITASLRLRDDEDIQAIIEENQEKFVDPGRWRVKHQPIDRTAIINVTAVPYWLFKKYWRKPINIIDAGLNPVGGGAFRFMNPKYFDGYPGGRITLWINWVEVNRLVESRVNSPSSMKNTPIFKFMKDHSPEIFLFTDGDSVFLDHQMEFAYIGDFVENIS